MSDENKTKSVADGDQEYGFVGLNPGDKYVGRLENEKQKPAAEETDAKRETVASTKQKPASAEPGD